MPAPSLSTLCKRQAIRILSSIDDFGTMPFYIVEPVIWKIQTAEQLHQIEQNSPHYIPDTVEIWRNLIKRDIPNLQNNYPEPEKPEGWYDLYRKLWNENERKIKDDALLLQASLQELAAKRQERTTNFVPARSEPRKGTRRLTPGQKAIENAKRVARQHREFLNKSSKMGKPSHTLNNLATKVRAPQSMISARKPLEIKVRAPTQTSITKSFGEKKISQPSTFKEREERLEALKAGKSASLPTDTQQRLTLEEREKKLKAIKDGKAALTTTKKRRASETDDLLGEASEEDAYRPLRVSIKRDAFGEEIPPSQPRKRAKVVKKDDASSMRKISHKTVY
jgi:hypothetical protein